jgi:hypothetical protein
MPFVNRFASPFAPPPRRLGLLRNHPMMLASGAATAGVLLGAFVAVQLLATPEKIDANATSPQAAAEISPAPPIAETTGSAPAVEPAKSDGATPDCDKQTWPYLSRDCMKNGGTRVITTDNLDRSTVGAIEGSKHPDTAKPAPAPAPAPSPPARSAVTASNPPPAAAATVATTTAVAPEPAAKSAPAAQPTAAPEQTAAKPELKARPKHVAKKQKRKPAKQELNGDDDDNNAVASGDSNDRFNDRRADRRRVVQRWNGRDRDYYDRRESDDDGQRRVIVIRRGGGLFGSLFGGNFGGGGDDDD